MTTVEIDARTACIDGLRKLADALEANEALGTPWEGMASSLAQYCDSREQMAAWVALLDDPADLGCHAGAGAEWYEVTGRIGGIKYRVLAQTKDLGGATVRREVETFEVEPFLPVQS